MVSVFPAGVPMALPNAHPTHEGECGDCIECCVVPEADLRPRWGIKPAGERCMNLWSEKPGCSVYDERPSGCRAFICWAKALLQGKQLQAYLRICSELTEQGLRTTPKEALV